MDITQADFLLSIGRGIGDKENVEMFKELADKMGATLSVSRPLVDAGWMPASRQVGQSGKTVKPTVYLALRDLGRRAAPRRDEDVAARSSPSTPTPRLPSSTSPITARVADLFDVAEELEKLF